MQDEAVVSEKPKRTAHLGPWQFKKGQSGNPKGSSEYRHRLRATRTISIDCLNRISEALFDGSLDGLKDLQDDPSITPIERLTIAVVIKAYEKGDAQALNMLLDRFIGKMADKVEVSSSSNPSAAEKVATIDRTILKQAMKEVEDEV